MKPAKLLLFPRPNLMILRSHVPQLIHDLVIHSVLLILGRLAPFPGSTHILAILSLHHKGKPYHHRGVKPLPTTRTLFTTLFLLNADP